MARPLSNGARWRASTSTSGDSGIEKDLKMAMVHAGLLAVGCPVSKEVFSAAANAAADGVDFHITS